MNHPTYLLRVRELIKECHKNGLTLAETIEVLEYFMRRKKTFIKIFKTSVGKDYKIATLVCIPSSLIPYGIDLLLVGIPVTNWGKILLCALEKGFMPRYCDGKNTFNTVAGKSHIYEILKENYGGL